MDEDRVQQIYKLFPKDYVDILNWMYGKDLIRDRELISIIVVENKTNYEIYKQVTNYYDTKITLQILWKRFLENKGITPCPQIMITNAQNVPMSKKKVME